MNMSIAKVVEEIIKLNNKFDKRFDGQEKRFEIIDKRFDDQENNFSERFEEQKEINKSIALTLLKIDLRFEKFEKQMANNHNQILNILDPMQKDIKDLKQEKAFIIQQYERLDSKVENIAKRITG